LDESKFYIKWAILVLRHIKKRDYCLDHSCSLEHAPEKMRWKTKRMGRILDFRKMKASICEEGEREREERERFKEETECVEREDLRREGSCKTLPPNSFLCLRGSLVEGKLGLPCPRASMT